MYALRDFLGRILVCCGILMFALAAFIAPDQPAYADLGSGFGNECAESCHDDSNWDSCINTCCFGKCGAKYGIGNNDFNTCMNECTAAAQLKCPGTATCDNPLNRCSLKVYGECGSYTNTCSQLTKTQCESCFCAPNPTNTGCICK